MSFKTLWATVTCSCTSKANKEKRNFVKVFSNNCHWPSVHLSPFCERVCFAGLAGAATFLQQVYRPQQEARSGGSWEREKSALSYQKPERRSWGRCIRLLGSGEWGFEEGSERWEHLRIKPAEALCELWFWSFKQFKTLWNLKIWVFSLSFLVCPISSSRLEPFGFHS